MIQNCYLKYSTERKVSKYKVLLVRIFSYLDLIRYGDLLRKFFRIVYKFTTLWDRDSEFWVEFKNKSRLVSLHYFRIAGSVFYPNKFKVIKKSSKRKTFLLVVLLKSLLLSAIHVRFALRQQKRHHAIDCNMFQINNKDISVCEIQHRVTWNLWSLLKLTMHKYKRTKYEICSELTNT